MTFKKNDPYCWIINAGALGDSISATPALKWAIENIFVNGDYYVMLHDYLRPLFHFIPEENIIYFGKGKDLTEPHCVVHYYDVIKTDTGPSATLNPLRMSLTDYSSIKLLGLILKDEDKNYPKMPLDNVDISKFELPEKYACILTTSLHKNRSLPRTDVYRIANYLIKKGITPVFMGKATRIIDTFGSTPRYGTSPPTKEGMLDLVDKTTIVEAAKVMAGAICVVGADTGLIHLAATTDVPIICGYTTVAPELRMPYRHGMLGWSLVPIVPPEKDCRYCSSDLFLNHVNFNECLQKDHQCIDSMSGENFIEAIESLLVASGI